MKMLGPERPGVTQSLLLCSNRAHQMTEHDNVRLVTSRRMIERSSAGHEVQLSFSRGSVHHCVRETGLGVLDNAGHPKLRGHAVGEANFD